MRWMIGIEFGMRWRDIIGEVRSVKELMVYVRGNYER